MDGIRYSVERTRNRASRAVLRDGTVLIRLARGLTGSEEQKHVELLLRRMAKVCAREAMKIPIDPFAPLLEGSETAHIDLVTGSMVSMRVTSGRKTKAMRMSGGWSVVRGLTADDATFRRFLWKLVSASGQDDIEKAVHTINAETFRAPIRSVSLKFMKSRWGSCSTFGDIAISTPLLCTTPAIFRYVVIHELAHILHPNHSAQFWRTVEAQDSGYRLRVKELKGFKLP